MELTEFAKLIASGSTNTAKNTLSYLIGNGQVNNNWSKALAELYKSFPEDIKSSKVNKKEFLSVILKYFENYTLTPDNIDIYKEYEDLFSAKNKDELKKKNPQWIWTEEPKVIFKNTLALVNAFPNPYNSESFAFIKQYEDQIDKFMLTQREKILKHFKTKGVWNTLMEEDYSKFIDFCDKYNINRIEILKEEIHSYTNLYVRKIFENDNINYYLEDLMKIGKENLKIIDNFYPAYDTHIMRGYNHYSVYNVLLEAIGNHQYKSAIKWMLVFEKELNDYTKPYNVDNIKNSQNFKLLLSKQIKMIKKSTSTGMSYTILELIENNEYWFKFLDKIQLLQVLKDEFKDNKTLVVKPNKI